MGTLVINITASFMLGAFVAYVDRRAVPLSGTLQLAIATGFIGTYSTFSTYMLETFRLAEKGAMALAAAYFVVSLVLGLAAVWAGMATVKALT